MNRLTSAVPPNDTSGNGTPTTGTYSAVAAGWFHNVAIRTDGTLVSWGNDGVGQVSRAVREYGMCMEMTDANALKEYDTHPYHKIWTEAYAKVRVEGTTTFNILGQ